MRDEFFEWETGKYAFSRAVGGFANTEKAPGLVSEGVYCRNRNIHVGSEDVSIDITKSVVM